MLWHGESHYRGAVQYVLLIRGTKYVLSLSLKVGSVDAVPNVEWQIVLGWAHRVPSCEDVVLFVELAGNCLSQYLDLFRV